MYIYLLYSSITGMQSPQIPVSRSQSSMDATSQKPGLEPDPAESQ